MPPIQIDSRRWFPTQEGRYFNRDCTMSYDIVQILARAPGMCDLELIHLLCVCVREREREREQERMCVRESDLS